MWPTSAAADAPAPSATPNNRCLSVSWDIRGIVRIFLDCAMGPRRHAQQIGLRWGEETNDTRGLCSATAWQRNYSNGELIAPIATWSWIQLPPADMRSDTIRK